MQKSSVPFILLILLRVVVTSVETHPLNDVTPSERHDVPSRDVLPTWRPDRTTWRPQRPQWALPVTTRPVAMTTEASPVATTYPPWRAWVTGHRPWATNRNTRWAPTSPRSLRVITTRPWYPWRSLATTGRTPSPSNHPTRSWFPWKTTGRTPPSNQGDFRSVPIATTSGMVTGSRSPTRPGNQGVATTVNPYPRETTVATTTSATPSPATTVAAATATKGTETRNATSSQETDARMVLTLLQHLLSLTSTQHELRTRIGALETMHGNHRENTIFSATTGSGPGAKESPLHVPERLEATDANHPDANLVQISAILDGILSLPVPPDSDFRWNHDGNSMWSLPVTLDLPPRDQNQHPGVPPPPESIQSATSGFSSSSTNQNPDPGYSNSISSASHISNNLIHASRDEDTRLSQLGRDTHAREKGETLVNMMNWVLETKMEEMSLVSRVKTLENIHDSDKFP